MILFYRDGCQGVPPLAATNPFHERVFCKSAFEKNGENGQVQIPAA